MTGLHSCKPGNEPQVGQIKTFLVEQRTGKSGKAYTKITSKKSDEGGQPYKILSAKPTGHTDSYGNHSFNIEVEPANGAASPVGSQIGAAVQHHDNDRSNRIERQHSQEMALRYFGQRGGLKGGSEGRDELRMMIDWFQLDIGHAFTAPAVKQPEPKPYRYEENDGNGPIDNGGDDDEIPF